MARTRGLVGLGGVFAVSLLCLAPAARAQAPAVPNERSFAVQLFEAPVWPGGFITLESAHVPAHKQFGLSLVTNYQRGAFTIDVQSDRPELANEFDVVENQFSAELTGALGLLNMFQVGIAVPLTLSLSGTDFTEMGQRSADLSASGIGDIRLEGKASLATFGPRDEFRFALAPGITLPTGDGASFLGDRTVSGRLRAITEYRLDQVRAAAMLGFLGRGKAQTFKAELGSQFLYAVALEYQVHRQVALLGEWFGRVGSTKFVDVNPSEIDAGMRVRLPHMLSVALGGGFGLNRGIGAPKFRGFLMLGWAPDFRDGDSDGVSDAEDRCPDQPEDRDGHKDSDGCPEPDNDGDGIQDAQDKCPDNPEDLDQFKDEDGCPEEDNDGDGIVDLKDPCPNGAEDGRGKRPSDGCPSSTEDQDGDGVPDGTDRCPDEPEDRDGFEDYDGCQDLDNDNDGIPDQFDGCPGAAEDTDRFEDEDGCPDLDNDRDGVPDAKDRCPTKAETLNGNRDDDGCPDSGPELVRLTEDRIEVREGISFGSGATINARGLVILNLVAMVLRAHDDIAVMRIEVTGGPQEQTQAQAEAVQAALVAAGIEGDRLRASGKGEGRSQVELIIESRQDKKTAPAAAPSE